MVDCFSLSMRTKSIKIGEESIISELSRGSIHNLEDGLRTFFYSMYENGNLTKPLKKISIKVRDSALDGNNRSYLNMDFDFDNNTEEVLEIS